MSYKKTGMRGGDKEQIWGCISNHLSPYPLLLISIEFRS
jgi:hypothetical protein